MADNKDLPIYFILAGQSNMCGRAFGKDLPKNYQDEYADTMMVWNNDMNFLQVAEPVISYEWKPLQPQYTPFAKQTQFGPEISLGRRLHKHFQRPVYLIKFAMGSTNLAINWNPNGQNVKKGKRVLKNYYNDFFEFTNKSVKSLKNTNPNAEFGGIFWMQGEGDAMDKKFSAAYYDNLKNLFITFREQFGECKIVTGLINWPVKYQDVVNNAIMKLATEDSNLETADTSDLTEIGYSYDPKYNNHHFDAKSLIRLGHRMADSYIKLFTKE